VAQQALLAAAVAEIMITLAELAVLEIPLQHHLHKVQLVQEVLVLVEVEVEVVHLVQPQLLLQLVLQQEILVVLEDQELHHQLLALL
jgi:hypothetical protein